MINIEKLERTKKHAGGKITAACPACRASGKDLKGEHLVIFSSGQFGCVVHSDKEHRMEILKYVGVKKEDGTFEYVEPIEDEIPYVERVFSRDILKDLVKDYDFYKNKGINEKILETLYSGVAVKGLLKDRYVFPIFNLKGQIHGFTGRTLKNANPKWKHVCPKSHWVYPAYFNETNLKECNAVILVESIGDMLALMNAGIMNVLVLFGTNLHQSVLSYLIGKNPNKIYISTNNDTHGVGQESSKKIRNKLANFFSEDKLEIKLPTKKDFGEMDSVEIKEFWKNAW